MTLSEVVGDLQRSGIKKSHGLNDLAADVSYHYQLFESTISDEFVWRFTADVLVSCQSIVGEHAT